MVVASGADGFWGAMEVCSSCGGVSLESLGCLCPPAQGDTGQGRIWGSSAEALGKAQDGHFRSPPRRHLCHTLAPTHRMSWVTLPCPPLSHHTSVLTPSSSPQLPGLELPRRFGPRELRGPQARRAPPGLSTPVQGTRSSGASCREERASPGTAPPPCLRGIILADCPCRCLDRVPLVPGPGCCPLAGWQCRRGGGRGRMSRAHPKCSQPMTLGCPPRHISVLAGTNGHSPGTVPLPPLFPCSAPSSPKKQELAKGKGGGRATFSLL